MKAFHSLLCRKEKVTFTMPLRYELQHDSDEDNCIERAVLLFFFVCLLLVSVLFVCFFRLTSRKRLLVAATRVIFLLAMVMRFFENVASPTRGQNGMCSHPGAGDAANLYFVTINSAR